MIEIMLGVLRVPAVLSEIATTSASDKMRSDLPVRRSILQMPLFSGASWSEIRIFQTGIARLGAHREGSAEIIYDCPAASGEMQYMGIGRVRRFPVFTLRMWETKRSSTRSLKITSVLEPGSHCSIQP